MATPYRLPQAFRNNGLFQWNEAMPAPIGRPVPQKEQIKNLLLAAAGSEYKGIWDPELETFVMPDPRFEGASIIEVAIMQLADRAAAGDAKAITELLDRTIDKPRQGIDAVTVTGTYSEFLENLAKQEQAEREATTAATTTSTYDPELGFRVFEIPATPSTPPPRKHDYEDDLADV